MNLSEIAHEIREFEGVKRKNGIGKIAGALDINEPDDTAVIRIGEKTLLFACDAINQELVEVDPYFAGYSAVLVNVNDVAAMGGRPVAVVDVISSRDDKLALEITMGMKEASEKFGVPLVGGHYNPNPSFDGVAVSIIGEAPSGSIIRGAGAKPGDTILVALDLGGALHPRYMSAWDSTSRKTPDKAQKDLDLLQEIAEKGVVNSCRDISNPGLIGTLGMLLEASRLGGIVDLNRVPMPPGVDLLDWLKVYPGYGFIFTAPESKVESFLSVYDGTGLAAAAIGVVRETPKLLISHEGKDEVVFDFTRMSITGA